MGLIAQRLATDEVRFDRGAWLEGEEDLGYLSSAGVSVSESSAFSLPVFWRCVDLLSSSIAQAPKDVIVKVGGKSFPEYSKPSWLTTPDPTDPNYTANDYFAQVAISLLMDGNFFTLALPYVWDVQLVKVLNPMRVRVKSGPLYELLDERGRVTTVLGPEKMLHGTWVRPPGALRGLNPTRALGRSIGSAIAAEEFAARFFGQGASLSFGVEVPGDMTPDQKADLREQLKRRHQGLGNSHAIGVLTKGAKFVTGLAPTPEQAQMLATRKFAVEETCRPFGVPPGLVGSQEPGASSYASAEVFDKQFAERAVLPLAVRIEKPHERLLTLPAGITDPNASMQFRFNLDGVARSNILNRYQAYAEGVTKGFLTPDEARAKEDLQPLPGNVGQVAYMQTQMVPVGTTPQVPVPASAARSTEEAA